MAANESATKGRVINFSAGPATLPLEVLEKVRDHMLNFEETGMSVMEMSHRSATFGRIIQEARDDCRELLSVPDNYEILFAQGGATTQFSSVAYNLCSGEQPADYLVTGGWSKKAAAEAKRLGMSVNVVASNEAGKHTEVPPRDTWETSGDARFFYYCANETVHGVQMQQPPKVNATLVCDFSSCFMSAPIPIEKFGVVYAGAQKNVGPAGVTVVIVRKDLLGKAPSSCPLLLDWNTLAKKESMYNTPPTFSIYVMGLVFKWLKKQGGLAQMEKINQEKAQLLYTIIDKSDMYTCPVAPADRSIMNVRFNCQNPEQEQAFLRQAEAKNMFGLKGHRSLGGIRASIYNAQSLDAVQTLATFMKDFEKTCKL